MEILEHAYNQALLKNEEVIEKWKRCISEYMCVKERLETFRNELSLKIMVPLGSKALMRGKLYHTNEILVHLGDGWFTKRSTHQALEICDRRIKNAGVMLQAYEQERSWLMSKRDIPKLHDVFSNSEHNEIIEDFDEAAEKEWRIKHAQNVRRYHQQLAKEREDEHNKTDEKFWERLEELEIQEEFERELEKSNEIKSADNSQNIFQHLHSDAIIANQNEPKIVTDNRNTNSNSEITKEWIDENVLDLANDVCDSECNLPNYNNEECSNTKSSSKHETDEISEVVLLERKSNACENLPIKMKLSYDFIGAFEDVAASNDVDSSSHNSSQSIKLDDQNIICNQVITDFGNPSTRNTKVRVNNRVDSEKISNVKLLHRESNINENISLDVKFGEESPEIIPRLNNSSERGPRESSVEKSNNFIDKETHENKSKHDLLDVYKKQLSEITNIINSTAIKSHEELCKQLDNYDLKEELEHKIMLLQDELNIANDNLDSDSSENSTYETNSIPSEKSLKRVSFTEKDHTKYLDEDTPDPPLILNFIHSTNNPKVIEPRKADTIESPHDIYRLYKNCFMQNEKPYKSILKKTTSNIIKNCNDFPYKEPCVGDSSKTQITKKKVQVKSQSIVIGDVSENKMRVVTSDTKIKPPPKGPMSRFKSMRHTLK